MTNYEYIFRQMKKFHYMKWDEEELRKCVDMLPSLSREELFSLYRSRWSADAKALREAIACVLAKKPIEKRGIRYKQQNSTMDAEKPLKRLKLENQENLPKSQHVDASKLSGEAMLRKISMLDQIRQAISLLRGVASVSVSLKQPIKTGMDRAIEDIEQGRVFEASSVEDLINQCKA